MSILEVLNLLTILKK